MNILSILPLLMLSISVYVGLYHLIFYFRERSEKFNLYFALTCFSVAAYDYFSSGLYNSLTVSEGSVWQNGQFISLIFFVSFFTYFLKNLINSTDKREDMVFSFIPAAMLLFLISSLISHDFVDPSSPLIRHISFLNITIYEAEPGNLANILYVFFMLIMVWGTYIILKYYFAGFNYLRSVFIAIIIFFVTAVNDILMSMNLMKSIYLMEYGFLCIIIGLAAAIQKKYLDMHHTINQLNVTLEKQVKERTGELLATKNNLEISNQEYRELLQVLCHDLANNLGSVSSCLEMINDHDVEYEELSGILKLATDNGLGLIELVRDFRALEEKKFKIVGVNLLDAVNNSLTIFSKKLTAKNINVDMNIPAHLTVLVERISFINSVLNNILSNAIKFSYPDSNISIKAEKNGEHVNFKIIDNGIGIAPLIMKEIFDIRKSMSRTGTEGETGIGFGMPLINKFINLYGAAIKIVSIAEEENPGKRGTTVTLHLKT